MALDPLVYRILDEQYTTTLAIDEPEVIDTAKRIAFYAAMIDAAEDSPLDHAEDHQEMMEFMKGCYTSHVEHYQQLVNDLLL